MPQLKQTCSVTNASQVVVMAGVNVANQIRKHAIFMIEGEHVPYFVAANAAYVNGNTTFSLTGAYMGATRAAPGIVVKDMTFPHSIPTIAPGDVGTAAVFTAAMYRIQELLSKTNVPIDVQTGPANTDELIEGNVNKYFTDSRVRGALLTGMQTVTSALVVATDSVIGAIQKLQAQITAHQGKAGITVHPVATTTTAGFMSAADKAAFEQMKLNSGTGTGTGGTAVGVTVGPTAPESPVPGQQWVDTDHNAVLLTWVNDGNSAAWVQL
jgi:hypothetical protein